LHVTFKRQGMSAVQTSRIRHTEHTADTPDASVR
jgi:hypothetical protein